MWELWKQKQVERKVEKESEFSKNKALREADLACSALSIAWVPETLHSRSNNQVRRTTESMEKIRCSSLTRFTLRDWRPLGSDNGHCAKCALANECKWGDHAGAGRADALVASRFSPGSSCISSFIFARAANGITVWIFLRRSIRYKNNVNGLRLEICRSSRRR